MKPYWKQDNNIIYQGHVLEVLKGMDDESVQMCVTSPPYWGLRDYGLEPMVWDGDENCRHEWGMEHKAKQSGGTDNAFADKKNWDLGERSQGQFCQLCNAWRGSLGLEPTPELFIDHIVQIFREVWRVLRKDGTVWLNLGDSYTSGNRPDRDKSLISETSGLTNRSAGMDRPQTPAGLKPKDLIGIPWRAALALQADGWYLRSDIIWAKPNPMPESVTDRPTKSHEYLFLLSKSPKYYYDAEAIKEPAQDWGNRDRTNWSARIKAESYGQTPHTGGENGNYAESGRNKRTVWTIATQPMPEAHFATFPEKLIEPCILAGTSEKGCCVECGAPWERVVEKSKEYHRKPGYKANSPMAKNKDDMTNFYPDMYNTISKTTGWQRTCKCDTPGTHDEDCANRGGEYCTVLDPFFGSGTTALVAYKHGRNFIGIELSELYLKDIAIPRIEKATNQLKLF